MPTFHLPRHHLPETSSYTSKIAAVYGLSS